LVDLTSTVAVASIAFISNSIYARSGLFSQSSQSHITNT